MSPGLRQRLEAVCETKFTVGILDAHPQASETLVRVYIAGPKSSVMQTGVVLPTALHSRPSEFLELRGQRDRMLDAQRCQEDKNRRSESCGAGDSPVFIVWEPSKPTGIVVAECYLPIRLTRAERQQLALKPDLAAWGGFVDPQLPWLFLPRDLRSE